MLLLSHILINVFSVKKYQDYLHFGIAEKDSETGPESLSSRILDKIKQNIFE
jgi:hypothetical protein